MVLTTRMPGDFCPACAERLDKATGLGRPAPGDFSVTACCATICRFDKDLVLRVAPAAAVADEGFRAQLHAIQDAVRRWPRL